MSLDEILVYFPVVPQVITYGLFDLTVEDRVLIFNLENATDKIIYTYYPEAKLIPLTENVTLLDMFHGYCSIFAKYFSDKHKDFQPMQLTQYRKSGKPTTHMFCVKHLDNNSMLFVDARGLCDNPKEFFAEYLLNIESFKLQLITLEQPISEEDTKLCELAYNKIFTDCEFLRG